MALNLWLDKLRKQMQAAHDRAEARYYYFPDLKDRAALGKWLKKSAAQHERESQRHLDRLSELRRDISDLDSLIYWERQSKRR